MTWHLTGDLDVFESAARELVIGNPVSNTGCLTVLEALRSRGLAAFGYGTPLFGWHTDETARATGAFVHTPPFPLLIAELPESAAESLADTLAAAGHPLKSVNARDRDAEVFTDAWTARTGSLVREVERQRLYRLGTLTPPDPAPAGRARFATARDTDTLVAFLHAFRDETEQIAEDVPGIVAFKLSRGEYVVWEADGGIVSMAAVSATVAGAARIAQVYTPPHLRRLGFAAAVTAARAAATLKDGADTVLLFTDLANPTSNSVYQRIGFVPVEDRVIVGFPAHEDEEIPT